MRGGRHLSFLSGIGGKGEGTVPSGDTRAFSSGSTRRGNAKSVAFSRDWKRVDRRSITAIGKRTNVSSRRNKFRDEGLKLKLSRVRMDNFHSPNFYFILVISLEDVLLNVVL